MSVSVVDSGSTITISDGNSTINPYKDKITVYAQGTSVKIQWDARSYVSYPYTDFTAPTGASATAVADLIAAMLDTNPAEGVSGSGTTNYMSKWTSSTAIGNSQIFDNGTQVGFSASPTARWHLPAGATGASTAPLKFTTGTSMTTAEAGAVEFTTDDLFFTITTGAARKRLLMADAVGGLTSTRVPYATTNGRLTDSANMTYSGTRLSPNYVTLAAGTATAGTAPLVFTTGTSLTSAIAGAMEFTTDDLFFTITTGAARKRLLMADPVGGITSTTVPRATTNGRMTDSTITDDGTTTTILTTNITLDSSALVLSGSVTVTSYGAWTHRNNFTLLDVTDTTKAARFVVSTIAAGATRLFTFPNNNGTFITSGNLTDITATGTIASGTWNGTVIGLTYGGTNANLTASNGGIFYSTDTSGAILSGTATAGQMLRSGASAAPTWSTATFPATAGASGTMIISDGTNWITSTATYPNTVSANQILFASSINVVGSSAQLTYAGGSGSFLNSLSTNAGVTINATNANTGGAAMASLDASNGTITTRVQALGTSFTTAGLLVANLSTLRTSSTAGLLMVITTSNPIIFATAGTAAANERMRIIGTGNVAISGQGTDVLTAPTAFLHLGAGQAAASSAPLKFTTGTSLTSAEAGAMEFTTDDLFFTITTGTARKRLLMADPVGGLTSGRVPFATTNGRLTDDAAATFVPATTGFTITSRLSANQGADVASATNLTLGADGNTFEITGTTQIDLILITSWRNGSVITLVFNESLTVRHGIATSGSNVTILLAGAANFSATANDTLTLVLCETTAGGQAWRELARTVI